MRGAFFFLGMGLAFAPSAFSAAFEITAPPCAPVSEFAEEHVENYSGDIDFCAKWNPEFVFNGHHCCKKPVQGRKRRQASCSPWRRKSSYCDEMTPEQKEYQKAVAQGEVQDVLGFLSGEVGKREQSYCNVNNGFLAWGRQIVSTPGNRIAFRTPGRCTNFGTDRMAAMIEWLGRQISKEFPEPEYKGLQLVVGDVSAPRGGCLAGKSGRKGHASHMTGQDADVGFLVTSRWGRFLSNFVRQFDPVANWWLIKKVFKNPYACVKIVFLDHRWIAKLSQAGRGDPDWPVLRRFIRHIPGHRDHFHFRVGASAGEPGCNGNPDLEEEDDMEEVLDQIEFQKAKEVQEEE